MLGDLVCRRFFSFLSVPHRLAAAFLYGFVISSCFTYLFALAFFWTSLPLLYSNILFFAIAVGLILLLRRSSPYEQPGDGTFALLLSKIFRTKQTPKPLVKLDSETRPQGSWKWDLACLSVCFIFSCWLMFATLGFSDGSFQFSVNSWSDFGPHLSLSQSFAWGNNFPTEHPFYPGETIRYHFLFWFQAANLSFLGLNLAWAINLLSILSLMSLLVLIMTFAELLFGSRVVGRIAALLFFFSATSLSYIPFLLSQSSLGETISSIVNARHYLKSGFPYYGDDWGSLTVGIFSYQRHLIIGTGILFLVLVFLIDFYRRRGAIAVPEAEPETAPNTEVEISPEIYGPFLVDANEALEETKAHKTVSPEDNRHDIKALIFCGLLIGALPYLNSAVFVAATIIIFGLLLFLPQRRYLVILIAATVVIALPQVLMLRSGNSAPDGGAMFYWGYIIADPTLPSVLNYLAWTFGFKWLLLLIAMWFLTWSQRRLFLAFSLLIPVVFTIQLSTYIFNNHKLLNIWNIFATIYIAYAIWYIGKASIARAALAVALTVATVFGSVIDLFPLHNDSWIKVPYKNDRLTDWVFENTNHKDVFLADRLISHPILFAGRKVFLGHTTFVWTAGYEFGEREKIYKEIFLERRPSRLMRLLRTNNIAYVAIDDGLRKTSGLDESIFQQRLEKVFEDTENRYGNLTIYRVPPAPL